MIDVVMPQMGESIAEGTVTKWMKNVGDKVLRDEPLFEISTDKVDAEIPSPGAGILKEIRVQPGQTVAINTVVGVIATEAELTATPTVSIAATASTPVPPPAAAPKPPTPAPAAVRGAAPSTGVPPGPTPPAASAPSAGVTAPASPAAGLPSSRPTPPGAPRSLPDVGAVTLPPSSVAARAAGPSPEPPAAAAFSQALQGSAEARPSGAAPGVAAAAAAPQSSEPRRAGAELTPTEARGGVGGATQAPQGAEPRRAGAEFTSAEARGGVGGATQAPPTSRRPEMTVEDLRLQRSSPVVRKIAAEHGVDIAGIPGSGVSGRVTKLDIITHLEQRGASEAQAPLPTAEHEATLAAGMVTPSTASDEAAPAPFMPAFKPGERVEVVPMSPIRKKTAEHLTLSKRIAAHVSTVWEVDLSRVDQLRKKHKALYEERHGVKLTYLPFIFKATVDALKAFPVLNSSVSGDSIVYKKDVNLGLAVALDWGLIVPVIKAADEKNVLGLSRAISDLAQRARAKKLKVDEIQGGTFTITNPGVFGSLFGTPIINQPQVAILGVGTIEKRPVVRDDAIAVRTMCYLALTFDHRIVDGADADRFMAHLKKGLQEFDESAL